MDGRWPQLRIRRLVTNTVLQSVFRTRIIGAPIEKLSGFRAREILGREEDDKLEKDRFSNNRRTVFLLCLKILGRVISSFEFLNNYILSQLLII